MFSENVLNLGRIHWYLLRASNLMEQKRNQTKNEASPLSGDIELGDVEQTSFTDEVEDDEINWWVFKRERDPDTLQKRTELALQCAQILKQETHKLHRATYTSLKSLHKLEIEYERFASQYQNEISMLLDYVRWLSEKNILAPTILFNYRTWGATRMFERSVGLNIGDINDIKNIELISLNVLGLIQLGIHVKDKNRFEMEADAYENIDPEDFQGRVIRISNQQVEMNAAKEATGEFADYYKAIRDSLRNILIDIKKRKTEETIFSSDTFWREFILKASQSTKTEQPHWDFKSTLGMWQIKNDPEKSKAEHKFIEQIAGFANHEGGVIVVGITDQIPRRIIGLNANSRQIEDYMKYTRKVIAEYLGGDPSFTHLQQVLVPDASGILKMCLVIAIRQTSKPIMVKNPDGRNYSFPSREETGLAYLDPDELQRRKLFVKSNNFNFLSNLKQFIYEAV